MKTSGGRSGSILPCRIRFFRDSTRLIFLLLPSRPRPPAVGTRIRQPRKLAPDCAGLLEALYFLAYCWAETCERRRLCLRGSVLLLPAPGAGPAAAPRARTQLCKHEGAVSTVSLVSPSPVSQLPSSVPSNDGSRLTSYRQLVLPGRQVGQVRTRCPRVSAVQAAALAVPGYITKYFLREKYFCLVITTEPPALSPDPALVPASPVACRSCPSLLPPAASAARSSSSSCGGGVGHASCDT